MRLNVLVRHVIAIAIFPGFAFGQTLWWSDFDTTPPSTNHHAWVFEGETVFVDTPEYAAQDAWGTWHIEQSEYFRAQATVPHAHTSSQRDLKAHFKAKYRYRCKEEYEGDAWVQSEALVDSWASAKTWDPEVGSGPTLGIGSGAEGAAQYEDNIGGNAESGSAVASVIDAHAWASFTAGASISMIVGLGLGVAIPLKYYDGGGHKIDNAPADPSLYRHQYVNVFEFKAEAAGRASYDTPVGMWGKFYAQGFGGGRVTLVFGADEIPW